MTTVSETPTYWAVHNELHKVKGKASAHPCGSCSNPAQEWAYDNADPNELLADLDGRTVRYSADLNRYVPMCRSCHRRLDSGNRRRDTCNHGHEFDEANTYWWRGTRHCRECRRDVHRRRRAARRGGAA